VVLLMLLQINVAAQTAKQLWSKPTVPGLQWTCITTDGIFITATTGEASLRTPLLMIVDPQDGRLVIDPQLYNEIFNTGFMTEPSRVWIEGMFGNTRKFSVYDLESGKRLWAKSDYFELPEKEEHKKYGFDKTVSDVVVKVKPPEDQSSPPGLLSTPDIPDNEHMILEIGDRVNYKNTYKISLIDGDVESKTTGPVDKVPLFEKQPPSLFKSL